MAVGAALLFWLGLFTPTGATPMNVPVTKTDQEWRL